MRHIEYPVSHYALEIKNVGFFVFLMFIFLNTVNNSIPPLTGSSQVSPLQFVKAHTHLAELGHMTEGWALWLDFRAFIPCVIDAVLLRSSFTLKPPPSLKRGVVQYLHCYCCQGRLTT